MFFKSLKYDLRNGCAVNIKKYALAAAVSITFCLDYYIRFTRLAEFAGMSSRPGFLEYIFYIFAGNDEFDPTKGSFSFPAIWTLIFVFISYMTLNYPFNDLNFFGRHVLINIRSRRVWWYSKCCWIIVSAAIVNLIIFAASFIFALLTKSSFSPEISDLCVAVSKHSNNYFMYDPSYTLGAEFFLPFFVTCALCITQMTVSLIIKPNISFMLTVAYIIACTFYKTPFLFLNYSIFIRCSAVAQNGLSPLAGMIISAAITAVSAVAGSLIFSRYDILNRE